MTPRQHTITLAAPEVLAALAGPVTLWRPMDPQPHPKFLARGLVAAVPQWPLQNGVRWFMADGCSELVRCPFGAPGDVLVGLEAFAIYNADWSRRYDGTLPDDRPTHCGIAYQADHHDPLGDGPDNPVLWRPAELMPHWAARIRRTLLHVGVERREGVWGWTLGLAGPAEVR